MPAKTQHDSDDELSSMGANLNTQKYFDLCYSEKFMKSLPDKIKNRVEVLLKYHDDYMELLKKVNQQEHELRKEFEGKYRPIFERRREIISGMGSGVTDAEVMKGFPKEYAGKIDTSQESGSGHKEVGLPEFWLRALSNNATLANLISTRDEGALAHLIDISSHVIDDDYGSFEVVFTFSPNVYFHEQQLTLAVLTRGEAPTIKRGPLTWKKGKNLTVEPVKLHSSKRSSRAQAKSIPCESFFNLFQDKSNDEEDEHEQDVINILRILHNNIIPCAILHYTGEADGGDGDMYVEDHSDSDTASSDTK